MGWLSRKSSTNWTVIRGAGDHAYLAELELRQDAKPLVKRARKVAVDIRSKSGAKALVSQFGLKKARCCFVLDTYDYQLLQTEKPAVPAEEQKQALRWKLKDMLDYPVEQATIDFVDILPDPNHSNRQQQVYAFAVKNQLLADITNTMLDAGMNLQAIDARVMGQRNVSAMLEENNRGVAMLSLTKRAGLLTFTAGGELYHVRSIEFNADKTDEVFERMVLELQRSLDNFERQYPHIPINTLQVAPFDGRESLCQQLRDSLYIGVKTFDLTEFFDCAKGVDLGDLSLQGSLLSLLGVGCVQR